LKNAYSISEFIANVYSLILTKIFYPTARLIRRPVYIRGRKGLRYGKGLTTGHGCRFDMIGKNITLVLGENSRIGDYVHIVADSNVNIGDNVLMASKVFISDTNHGIYNGENQSEPEINPNERPLVFSPVVIGNNVWLGENAVILAGTTIGSGCIVGANAVVSGSFPDECIIVGVPARIIKRYNNETRKWETVT